MPLRRLLARLRRIVRRSAPLPRRLWRQFSRSSSGELNVLYVPNFDSVEELADQYHRILWYMHPLHRRLGKVMLPLEFAMPDSLPRADYLDPAIERFAPLMHPKLAPFDGRDVEAFQQAVEVADVVLHWRKELAPPSEAIGKLMEKALAERKRWYVDRRQSQYEGSFYLKLSHDANLSFASDLADSKRRFAALAEKLAGRRRGYVYGTGPSLSQALERDVSDGVSIVCNSMVRNRKLLDHLQPPVIVVGDPIFHAGCSSYAGEFREHLVAALRRYGSDLIVPFRDYKLYVENLPSSLRERIIGIPLDHVKQVNLDLRRSFLVKSTGNILTLFLLPLAATFFHQIGIMGCDGRPLDQDDYFWRHDPSAQLNDQMEAIRRCHPGFFDIDYNDYYLNHCATLETWIEAIEAQGIAVENLTPSYIPALKQRTPDEIGAAHSA